MKMGFSLTPARRGGPAVIAILTMAVGIGLTTAVFSLVYAVLLRPLPYRDPDRLVAIWERHEKSGNLAKVFDSYRDFLDWQEHSRSFEGLAALTWARGPQTLTGRGQARPVTAFPASVELFPLLGVPAQHGRTFVPADLDRGCVVVLAHRFWANVLGSDPAIVGQSLALDGQACTVAGVMPATFTFYPEETELWTLITPRSEFARQPDGPQAQVGVFGRLRPETTMASAQAELTQLHRLLHARIDPERQPLLPVVYPLRDELTWMAGRNLRTSLMLLFAAVLALLLVACLNVAGVLVGRGLAREREMAMRIALGATRLRVVRLVLSESATLAAIGAAGGLLVATGALRIMEALRPVDLPPGTRLVVDWPVLLFTMAATAITALLFGLWPAWRASRTDVNVILQATSSRGTSGGRWAFAALVIAEVTLSVLVLAGAALLIQSVTRFAGAPLGFNPDRVVTQRIALPVAAQTAPTTPAAQAARAAQTGQTGQTAQTAQAAQAQAARTVQAAQGQAQTDSASQAQVDRYAAPERRWRFYEPLLARASAQPGVEAVAISSSIPLSIGSSALTVEGRAPTVDTLRYDTAEQAVTASYFRLLDIPLHTGRLFDDRDRADSLPVVIINEALAREYFGDEQPLGRRIRFGTPQDSARNPWLTIVGVIGTEQRSSVFQEMAWIGGAVAFRPLSQSTPTRTVLLARASAAAADPTALLHALQRDIATLDPTVPIGEGGLLRDELDKRLAYPRFRAALLGLFAALALLLAALGLYGVLSHAVAQRTREIAIRMALGAVRGDVLRLVAWQGLKLAAVGTALGLIAAWNSTQLVATLLYGVRPTDAASLAGAALVVLAVSLVAIYIPARRAARLDPLVALKRE
jgi:hypothetical protein